MSLAAASEGRRLEVFTTNYDLVIESALDHARESNRRIRVFDGFRTTRQMDWSPGLHKEFYSKDDFLASDAPSFAVYKLHGSVDWTWSNGLPPICWTLS